MANDNVRARIVEAAGEVFAERGYAAATVRDICRQAGVNLAAVNYYFGGKEQLYVETLERAHARSLKRAAFPESPVGTPPQAKLRQFVHSLLDHLLKVQDEPWEMRLMTREIISPTAAGRRLLRRHFRAGFAQLLDILDEILPPAMPPHQRHQIALSILGQCVYYRAAGKIIPLVIDAEELQAHYGTDELAAHIARVSLAALGLEPPLVEPASDGAVIKRPASRPAKRPRAVCGGRTS